MKKFVETVKRGAAIIGIITGLVLAVGAALQAFTAEMKKHYPEEKPQVKSDETTSN